MKHGATTGAPEEGLLVSWVGQTRCAAGVATRLGLPFLGGLLFPLLLGTDGPKASEEATASAEIIQAVHVGPWKSESQRNQLQTVTTDGGTLVIVE